MTQQTKNIAVATAAVIIAFIGGMLFGKHSVAKAPAINAQFGGMQQQGRMNGGAVRGAGGFVTGTVLSKDEKSITIQSQGTGSKIVVLSPSTTVSKSTTGTLEDVAVGSSVTVTGATNSDGSITAQSVQLRPAGELQARPQRQ
jgi:hypothetical protein